MNIHYKWWRLLFAKYDVREYLLFSLREMFSYQMPTTQYSFYYELFKIRYKWTCNNLDLVREMRIIDDVVYNRRVVLANHNNVPEINFTKMETTSKIFKEIIVRNKAS